MWFTAKSEISNLKIIVCDKKNQNGYCKKAEKIKQSDLNETISTKNSNINEKIKVWTLKLCKYMI